MAGYKDIAAESPLVPDDGRPDEYHARKRYIAHFGHEPPQSLIEHWRKCQEEGKKKKGRGR